MPVVEALACGTPIVASDLPILREVGGDAATYCPVGDVNAWSHAVGELLSERATQPEQWATRCQAALDQASGFSWKEHARKMMQVYEEVLQARSHL